VAVPDILSRAAVVAKLGELLASARSAERGLGVLIIRIGGLRRLTLGGGYAAGDRVLIDVHDCLRSVVRRDDWIGRIGDQDFVFLAPHVTDEGQLLLGANRLLRALETMRLLHGAGGTINLSIGVAAFPKHGSDPERLLWAAEVALGPTEQHASPVSVAGSERTAPSNQYWQVETLLSRAVERGEVELHYQPKFGLRDGVYEGVEALARWTSVELGAVSPAVFIPIAEGSEIINDLTWSCINSALQQLADWRSQSFSTCIAVNISAICLRAGDFSERIRGALALWNVKPFSLTLEITESAIMNDPERGFQVLRDLREFGVRISIDDFGTGHSSFSYFRALPADELKIDRSFVATLATSAADGHIVRSIIDLAHKFGFTVVAEGVEDAETVEILRDMRCDIAQGYYFGHPTAAENIPALANARLQPSPDAPHLAQSSRRGLVHRGR
jgi:diguanylate cyclase (GGDEF)-like protein